MYYPLPLTKGRIFLKQHNKSDQSILGKATRPSTLKRYPKYGIEHIRDSLRFKAVVNNLYDAFVLLCLVCLPVFRF